MADRPEPDLNWTRPQRGLGFGLRARTRPGLGLGLGEKGLRTGPDRTAATLIHLVTASAQRAFGASLGCSPQVPSHK